MTREPDERPARPISMRRILTLVAHLVAAALLASACGDDTDTVTADEPDDPGTRPSIAGEWVLQSLAVDGVAVTLPDGELEITIELGEIRGNLGCNSFFGAIDVADDGTLTVGGLGQTEMACEDQSRMEFEFTYGQALSSATEWAVSPTALTLRGPTVDIVYTQVIGVCADGTEGAN